MKRIFFSILLIGLVLLLASSVAGCARNPLYVYENGATTVGGDEEPIELINNPNATNPTYAELVAFIKADTTDTNDYVLEGYEAYVCSDFAEDVHNNAEAAGIRAAFVSMYFEGKDKGHALDAFETTDRGLVYICCTGGGLWGESARSSWDKVAYVEIGKELGVIDIVKADSLSYSFYGEYKQKWQEREKLLSDFNEEIAQYNQETRGKVYYTGSPERARIKAWKARLEEKKQVLEELGEELGDFWFKSLGVVKDTHIHWGKTE